MEIKSYSTWLEIDLKAIKDNVKSVHQITGSEVIAVFKVMGLFQLHKWHSRTAPLGVVSPVLKKLWH